jgi:hypothetical protein
VPSDRYTKLKIFNTSGCHNIEKKVHKMKCTEKIPSVLLKELFIGLERRDT